MISGQRASVRPILSVPTTLVPRHRTQKDMRLPAGRKAEKVGLDQHGKCNYAEVEHPSVDVRKGRSPNTARKIWDG